MGTDDDREREDVPGEGLRRPADPVARQVEDAARADWRLFRQTADTVAMTVWLTDAQGRCTFVNEYCRQFFQVPGEVMTGTGWRAVLHPDDADEYLREFDRATAEQRAFRAVARVRRADGQWRWIETSTVARFDEAGTFLGLTGSNADVTDHVRREADAQFHAAVAGDFARLASPEELLRSIGDRVHRRLGLASWRLVRPGEDVPDLAEGGPEPGAGGAQDVGARLREGRPVALTGPGGDRLLVPYAPHGTSVGWRLLADLRRPGPGGWGEEEVRVVADLLPRLDVALVRVRAAEETAARYARARDVEAELQRALLPAQLPLLPRLDLAAQYLVAGAEQAAGGDWFDALALPDGRVALVVGDVVGHGVVASAVMSQLRTVLSERLGAGAGLDAALDALRTFAAGVPGARAATACVAVVDTAAGDVEYRTLGHPSPLLVAADGSARPLPRTGAAPLGGPAGGGTGTARLEDGELLVLHSDGLLEGVAGDPLRLVAGALAGDAGAGAAGRAVQRVCERAARAVREGGPLVDDVTVLAAQRRPAPAPLRLAAPAVPTAPLVLRRGLRAWLEGLEVEPRQRQLVELAAGEAVTNAVEHAYAGGGTGTVQLSGELADDGVLHLAVTDRGRWRQPAALPGDRGRGLALMGIEGGRVRVEATAAGTTVRLARRLHRPVAFDAGASALPAPAGARVVPDELRWSAAVGAAGPVLRVEGPLEAGGAPGLREEVLRLARHGSLPVTVELSATAPLASAGVQVLVDVLERLGPDGVRLVAADSSIAAAVLDLASLPRRDATGRPSPAPAGRPAGAS
ncbi:SpoIIE family protein phosphatase [Kineococcus sp. SYSU DK006]|uniref:SpoIIE family protein phosphatase n=1 Tax=Kineococcus sp. SYSU DK006 TaxID=3383127 RepID=UPI003D7DF5C3